MGVTKLADIPGNRFIAQYHNASAASDGAAAIYGIMRAPQNIKLLGAYWTPYGADQAANGTSYRRVAVVNGGTAGTGTTVLASINLSASKASMGVNALSGTGTVTSGGLVVFSQTTVGGNHATGTVLSAGLLQVEYQLS